MPAVVELLFESRGHRGKFIMPSVGVGLLDLLLRLALKLAKEFGLGLGLSAHLLSGPFSLSASRLRLGLGFVARGIFFFGLFVDLIFGFAAVPILPVSRCPGAAAASSSALRFAASIFAFSARAFALGIASISS